MHSPSGRQLPPSGDSSIFDPPTQLSVAGVLELIPWRQDMQVLKSRLVVLTVVAAAAVAAVLGNYGWNPTLHP